MNKILALLTLFCLSLPTNTAEAKKPCVDHYEITHMPRTTKGAIERYFGQEGVRDQHYDEFAESFGMDPGRTVLFLYPSCEHPHAKHAVEIYYDRYRNKAWPLVASAYK